MKVKFYFIDQRFYELHKEDHLILDTNNPSKQGKRSHICVKFSYKGNSFYIPLRENLGQDVRPFGRIGHSVPSKKMPYAGLDYRNAVVINDKSLVIEQDIPAISRAQHVQIDREFQKIQKEFSIYLHGFILCYKRGVNLKRPLYKFSSLVYFLDELGLQ